MIVCHVSSSSREAGLAAKGEPLYRAYFTIRLLIVILVVGWLGSRVVSVLDSGAVGPGFKSQPRRCRMTVLGTLLTPVVPLFTKQRNC